MSEFVVHSVPGSPFGPSVLVVLEEKGARWSALQRSDARAAAMTA